MSKLKQAEQLAQFLAVARFLREKRRYPVAVVCTSDPSYLSAIVKPAVAQLPACHVDVTAELLLHAAEPSFFPTLGAYGPEHLVKWILGQCQKTEQDSLVVDRAEPLLATFGPTKAVAFFQLLGSADVRKPTMLVTYLSSQVRAANFPVERIKQFDAI